jgi:hypothetical protein
MQESALISPHGGVGMPNFEVGKYVESYHLGDPNMNEEFLSFDTWTVDAIDLTLENVYFYKRKEAFSESEFCKYNNFLLNIYRYDVTATKVPFCQGNNCRINRKFTIYTYKQQQKTKKPDLIFSSNRALLFGCVCYLVYRQ